MTCIVGLVDEGKVYIGGDSAGLAGWQLTHRKDAKVFRNGNFLLGFTSSFRMGQLLRYAFQPPECPIWDEVTTVERYMATTFVDAVRDCLKAGGLARKDNEVESGGHFLVGFQGRLFYIEGDYQVGESLDGYDACGCGADVALGTLYATPNMQSKKRIELALKAAEHHNGGVRAPFVIEVLRRGERAMTERRVSCPRHHWALTVTPEGIQYKCRAGECRTRYTVTWEELAILRTSVTPAPDVRLVTSDHTEVLGASML